MPGKHVAEDNQCDAICGGVLAEKWGYIEGSRCSQQKDHPTPRNGVGHYFAKRGPGPYYPPKPPTPQPFG